MAKSTKAPKIPTIPDAAHHVRTIGELERLAGIGPTHNDRAAFWEPFSRLGVAGLDAGVAELHRLIERKNKVDTTHA